MIEESKRKDAIDGFLKNPYWKRYYDNAPTDECREYIACTFSFSKHGDPDDLSRKKSIEPKLKASDWRYLYENEGNPQMKSILEEKMKKAEAK